MVCFRINNSWREISYDQARELVYGMPYDEYKNKHQKEATKEQLEKFNASQKTKAELQDKDLLRYNRNIVLPEIDIDGQLSLLKSKVAVIGLGGIGCPAATYLASSGVGHLCLIDFDHVSLSNLNRQVLFSEDDISEKVEAAKKNLQSLNSEIDIKSIPRKIDNKFDKDLLKDYDYIIDCTDNFQTRSEVNNISIANKIPLISGAQ